MTHITVIDRRASRRIMDWKRGGKRHNLCGAELTDRDVAISAARSMATGDIAQWVTCSKCLAILQETPCR